jgi:uncharacterized protein
MPLRNLPDHLVGKQIVHLSDLHIGPVPERYTVAWLTAVAAMEPWMVVITGDFMSSKANERIPDVVRQLQHLKCDSIPTYAVLGNHDYGQHWDNDAIAQELVDGISKLGVKVIRNEIWNVGGLQLVGLDDVWAAHCNVADLIPQVKPDRPTLTLLHNPDGLDHAGWTGYQGWVLSGHTHGGQCKPPFLNPPLLPIRNRRYASGHVDFGDGRQAYISRGLGYIKPVRFNARPEVIVWTLQRATS